MRKKPSKPFLYPNVYKLYKHGYGNAGRLFHIIFLFEIL